jgi:two-component SAPR family response regulator
MEMKEDRLEEFEKHFQRKKKTGTQLLWMKYNPNKEYKFDITDAREDVEWMISEIRRLRAENETLKEFIDSLRVQLEGELGGYKK